MGDLEFNENSSLYIIEFTDGSLFQGGSFINPNWRKCPDKNILSLKLLLPNRRDSIQLKDYDSYNFLIGAKKPLNGGETVLAHMYGFGRKNETVTSYRITLVSTMGNKYKTGDITIRTFPFGKEGIGRTSISGWKRGII